MLTGLSGSRFTLPHFWRFVIILEDYFCIVFADYISINLWRKTKTIASARSATPSFE